MFDNTGMKQTLMIKLSPNPEQYKALLETMERFNEGCNYTSGKAFETYTYGKFYLHHVVYGYLREHYKLSAQMAVRVVVKSRRAIRLIGKSSTLLIPTRLWFMTSVFFRGKDLTKFLY